MSIFPPNNTVNGTVYLNPLTGTFYINQNGEWVALGSLKKPNGTSQLFVLEMANGPSINRPMLEQLQASPFMSS